MTSIIIVQGSVWSARLCIKLLLGSSAFRNLLVHWLAMLRPVGTLHFDVGLLACPCNQL